MVNVGIFYDHLEYFMVIWYNLCPFDTVCGHLLYFPNLECLDQEKSGNPGSKNVCSHFHDRCNTLYVKFCHSHCL
jgi:hypothetical protein